MQRTLEILSENRDALLNGAFVTLELALLSFAAGLIVGIVLGIAASSPNPVLRVIVKLYVNIIRGIPLLVLAFFIFFGLPQLTGSAMSEFNAGVLALALNAGAYLTEIVRGGIQAVPKGQSEASVALGMPYFQTMFKVILPQAIRIMIPSFINQFVISLKDTTIISAIGLTELLLAGRKIVGRTFESFQVYFIIALIYLVIITALTYAAGRIEKHTSLPK
jgi:polar amino acid transport system substrate-binding protein